MTDIFISYSRQDRGLASKLATLLEEQGYAVWWDVSGLHGGQAFAAVIQEQISQAHCVIVLWSEASVVSNWVYSEAVQADSQGILLTAVYQDAPIPLPFNTRHNEDLRDWSGAADDPAFVKLLVAVQKFCSGPAPSQALLARSAPLVDARPEQEAAEYAVVVGTQDLGLRWKLLGLVVLILLGGLGYILHGQQAGDDAARSAENEPPPVEFAISPELPPAAPERYALTIQVTPAHASITLPDIEPRYRDGMWLTPGNYRVQIAAPGYQSREVSVGLLDSSKSLSIALEREPEPFLRWVKLPGGVFTMGCIAGRDDIEGQCGANEKPAHRQQVDAFMMSETEITVGQFRRFVAASGYRTTAELKGSCHALNAAGDWMEVAGLSWRRPGFRQTDEHPVVCVSWEDAQAFIRWLQGVTGGSYDLPSELQWEYAARGGNDQQAHAWGQARNEACAYANLADQLFRQTYPDLKSADCKDGYVYSAPVRQFRKNGFGLFDMHGNVWEWTRDIYKDSYSTQAKPTQQRVVRGGSWDEHPWNLRSANRHRFTPGYRRYSLGFRLVKR
ncbi:MAG: SUMF1/EgtB/PvdO family nonheme iron enzyme [Thiolinea sp.]